jgi:hypothetical protein
VSQGWVRRQLREIGASQPTDYSFESFEYFCALIEIRLKSGGRKFFRPEDWHEEQQKFNTERTGRDIVLKPRQVGFSTLELARDLHFAITRPGTSVLVVVHDGDLAEQLFLTLRIFAECLKRVGKLPKTLYSNKREIVFAATGSAVRIVEAGATTTSAEKKGRSGTVHRLHATEVAFWGVAAETMGAVLGAVPGDGEIVEESTPNGVGGLFYQDVLAAREGRNGMRLHFFPWWRHADYRAAVIPPTFNPAVRKAPDGKPDVWETKLRGLGCDDSQIAWWRAKVDDPKVGLERALQDFPIDVETCFRARGDAWLDAAVLDRIADRVRHPLRQAPIVFAAQRFEPARIFAEPRPGKQYVVFGDVAEGVAGDGSSAHVLERVTGETAATWWSSSTEPGDFGTVLAVLGYMYNSALVAPERNNHGHATLERLVKTHRYPRLFHDKDGRPGWNTTSANRPILWDSMAHAISEGAAWTPDAATLSECRSIVRDEDGKPRARGKRSGGKDAARDDRFVSWAGAWQLRSMSPAKVGGFHFKGL